MFSKLCRIGNDPEVRFTSGDKPTAVLSLSLAYSYGKKDKDGKFPTQWIEGTIWGKQAEAVAPYMAKGNQISVNMQDLHIEEYEHKGEKKSKLKGNIVSFDFIGKAEKAEPSDKQAPKIDPNKPFDDFDNSIPF